MEVPRGFFTNELFAYYLQFGKAVPERVLRVLDKDASELRGDEERVYAKKIAPGREAIKAALEDRLRQSGADAESWLERLPGAPRTIMEEIAAELLTEMGVTAGRRAEAFQGVETARPAAAPGAEPPADAPGGNATVQAGPGPSAPRSSARAAGSGARAAAGGSRPAYKLVLDVVFWSFFALVCLLLVLLALSLFNLGVRAFAISSSSMSPTIKAGSLVFVRPADEYRVGDVVTFLVSQGEYITHRIEEIRTEGGEEIFVTKGDANEDVDPYQTRREDIEGKVVLDLPLLGYAVAFLRTRTGFILIMCVFGLAIASLIHELVKEYPSRKGRASSGPNPD